MAVRPSMVDLIARLRVAVGDPWDDAAVQFGGPDGPVTHVFSDEQLQDFLDDRRTDVVAYPLTYAAPIVGAPTRFHAATRWWETDAVLTDHAGVLLVADASDSDPGAGLWVFTASPSSPVVYVSGRHFDFYGVAAAVMRAQAAKSAAEFDFTTDGQRFGRSQKHRAQLAMSNEYSRFATR